MASNKSPKKTKIKSKRNRIIFTSIASILIILIVAFSIYGSKHHKNNNTSTKKLKISFETSASGINDNSFNQSTWEGIQRAKKDFNIDANYIESKNDAEVESNFTSLIENNADLIVCIGNETADTLKKLAPHHPDKRFLIVDWDYGSSIPQNVQCAVFEDQQSSYLAGVLAAKKSKTGKIGFVGGINLPVVNNFLKGFKAGAKAVNPNIVVIVQYANSFKDAQKGNAIASQMFLQDVDVVFPVAGDTGTGVIEAARNHNKFVIGVDKDQSYLAPGNVIASCVKHLDRVVYNVIKDLVNGTFDAPVTKKYGLSNDGVSLKLSETLVSSEETSLIDAYKNKIINHEINI